METQVRDRETLVRNWQEFVEAVKRVSKEETAGQDGLALMMVSNVAIDHLADADSVHGLRFVGVGGGFKPDQEKSLYQFGSLSYEPIFPEPNTVADQLGLDGQAFTLGNTAAVLGLPLRTEGRCSVRITEKDVRSAILPGVELTEVLAVPMKKIERVQVKVEVVRRTYYDPLHLRLLGASDEAMRDPRLTDILEGATGVNAELTIATRLITSLISGNPVIGEWLETQANMPGTKGIRGTLRGNIEPEEEEALMSAIRLICWNMTKVLDLSKLALERTGKLLLSESMLRTIAYAAARSLTLSSGGMLVPYPRGLVGLASDLNHR